MKSNKNAVLLAAIATLLAAPLAAQADSVAQPFQFNADGTGSAGAQTVTTIDQAPGNALASGANTAVVGSDGTTTYQALQGNRFTLYYQANISAISNAGQNVFAPGLNSPYFTSTAGFGEVVSSASQTATTRSLGFTYDPTNPVNFFRIYESDTTRGDNLTGLGFSTGKLIYEGTISSEPQSFFNINLAAGTTQLDQFGTDDYAGTQTLVGGGSSTINVLTTYFDPGYFPSLTDGAIIQSNFNTSQLTPFGQVNPSACFASRTEDCAIQYNIGRVNVVGGPDVLLQADANQSLVQGTVARVPEPATTALLGLGMAFVGVFASRKKKQA